MHPAVHIVIVVCVYGYPAVDGMCALGYLLLLLVLIHDLVCDNVVHLQVQAVSRINAQMQSVV